jgi:hypothetical protein
MFKPVQPMRSVTRAPNRLDRLENHQIKENGG